MSTRRANRWSGVDCETDADVYSGEEKAKRLCCQKDIVEEGVMSTRRADRWYDYSGKEKAKPLWIKEEDMPTGRANPFDCETVAKQFCCQKDIIEEGVMSTRRADRWYDYSGKEKAKLLWIKEEDMPTGRANRFDCETDADVYSGEEKAKPLCCKTIHKINQEFIVEEGVMSTRRANRWSDVDCKTDADVYSGEEKAKPSCCKTIHKINQKDMVEEGVMSTISKDPWSDVDCETDPDVYSCDESDDPNLMGAPEILSPKAREELKLYYNSIKESEGFDIVKTPKNPSMLVAYAPVPTKDKQMMDFLTVLAKLAITEYNTIVQDPPYTFVRVLYAVQHLHTYMVFYITFEAKRGDESAITFQARVATDWHTTHIVELVRPKIDVLRQIAEGRYN